MKDDKILLTGTDEQKAHQLIEIFKNRKLSVKALREIVPMNVKFIETFGETLKKEMELGFESHKTGIAALTRSLELLGMALGDKDISPDLKDKVTNEISKINSYIYDLTNKADRDSHDIKKRIITCLFAIFGLIVMVASKGKIKFPGKA